MLSDKDLVGDLSERDASEVLTDFSGQSREDIRRRIVIEDPDYILEAFSIISPKGFEYFLPVFLDFSESQDSHGGGWQFPSWMALALSNKLRIHPEETLKHKSMMLRIIDSISTNISRFGTSDILYVDEPGDLAKLHDLRRKIQEAEQDIAPNDL